MLSWLELVQVSHQPQASVPAGESEKGHWGLWAGGTVFTKVGQLSPQSAILGGTGDVAYSTQEEAEA